MRRTAAAFTLLELMFVVTVIAIIAAIAIPNLVDAYKGGNEASAISSLRTIATACQEYYVRFKVYPPSLGVLGAGSFIDGTLAGGTKSGYRFGSWGGVGNGSLMGTATFWCCFARPSSPGVSGDRVFYSDMRLRILVSSDNGATWQALP